MLEITDSKLQAYQKAIESAPIKFEEIGHGYFLEGQKVPSVTTLLKEGGIATDYSAVDPVILERARRRGEAIHLQVEDALRNGAYTDCEEEAQEVLKYLAPLFKAKGEDVWQNVITEGLLFSKNPYKPFCGRFDILCEKGGRYSLYDIKTNKTETGQARNYARWQLSLYAYALAKEFKISVSQIAILRFKEEGGHYTLVFDKLDFIKTSKIEELLREGSVKEELVPLSRQEVGLFYDLAIKQEECKKLENDLKAVKGAIYEFMQKNDILKTTSEDGLLTITRVADSESTSIDSERLKRENPSIFEEYKKITPRKGYVRISLKTNKGE